MPFSDLDAMLGRFASATLYEVLDVHRRAAFAEIEAAYEILAQRFDPSRHLPARAAQIKAIRARIEYAYEVLGNPLRRAGYDAALGAPEERVRDSVITLDSVPPTDAREVVDRDLLGSLLPPARAPSVSPASGDGLFHAISVPPPPAPLDPAVFALEDPNLATNEPAPDAVLAEDRAAIPSMAPPPGAAVNALQAAMRNARPVRRPSNTRLVALAHQAAAQGDHAGAARVLAVASKVQPGSEELARHEREAVQRAAKRADVRPASTEDLKRHVEAAKNHEIEKQWEEAAASWSAAQRIAPHDDSIRKRASNAFARGAQSLVRGGGSLPRALELSRAAVAMCSDNVAAHVVMAQVFLTGGLKTSARRALETALELDPKSEPARALLAKL